jgi:hypothetical protein
VLAECAACPLRDLAAALVAMGIRDLRHEVTLQKRTDVLYSRR